VPAGPIPRVHRLIRRRGGISICARQWTKCRVPKSDTTRDKEGTILSGLETAQREREDPAMTQNVGERTPEKLVLWRSRWPIPKAMIEVAKNYSKRAEHA
jgi:hypothetical protein